MKTVCVVDENGFFLGVERAFPSPREPDVFLIPAGCVDIAPPPMIEGRRARIDADGATWVQVEAAQADAMAGTAAAVELQGAAAIQHLLDQRAQQSGYENILAAISYADEPAVPAFQAEGRRFRAWRSIVWAWFFADPELATASVSDLAEQIAGDFEELGDQAATDAD